LRIFVILFLELDKLGNLGNIVIRTRQTWELTNLGILVKLFKY